MTTNDIQRPVCNRCAACCKTGKDNHDCPFLVRIGNKAMCKIYHERLGVEIAPGFHCNYRKYTKYDFKGCPLNSGKPLANF